MMNLLLPILAQGANFLDSTTAERAEGAPKTFWMPFKASTYAGDVDFAFYFIYWISVVFSIIVFGALIYFTIKYRHKTKTHAPSHAAGHSTTLELTWTLIPTLLVVTIFYFGFRSYLKTAVIPSDAYEIGVNGQMWSWSFTYPDGHIDSELHVPAGVPIRLVMTSQDVIHSFYVPVFRIKKDAVPGRYNKTWFRSDQVGKYQAFCAEYCGTKHSHMGAIVVVHPIKPDDSGLPTWSQWEETSRDVRRMPPVEVGKNLYVARGCNQCHSLDGTAGKGPSWKDLFGNKRMFQDGGSAVADENYIVESILQPQAHLLAGFDPIMPSYQGRFKPDELTGIIAYMKSISQYYSGPETVWENADKPHSPETKAP